MNPEQNDPTPTTDPLNTTLLSSQPSMWQDLKNKARVKHLIYALILGVTGFGACVVAFTGNIDLWFSSETFFVQFASSLYLLSALFAISSIIAIFKTNPSTGRPHQLAVRIFVTIIALIIGGWGVWWGVIGILMSIDSSIF